MSAIKIRTAVAVRLTGYTVIIVAKVLLMGNTVYIHAMRIPHTPSIVRIAGTRDMP